MRKRIIQIILALLFLALFNVLFFVLGGTEHLPSVWVSYGFIHFAYLQLVFLPALKTKGQGSYYLLSALYVPSLIYFWTELIAGVVFIVLKLESMLLPLLVQSVIAAVFLVVILVHAWANESTARSLEKRRQETDVYRSNCMNLKRLLTAYAKNPALKKLLAEAYDHLEASASRQTEESQSIDSEIAQMISSLKQALLMEDEAQATILAKSLQRLIEERKAVLKYSH